VDKKMGRSGCDAGPVKANSGYARCKRFAPKSQPKIGGRKSRDKGNRAERALVRILQENGFAAERVPMSGSAGGSYCGDLTVPLLGVDRVAEVKVRARGFAQLYDWLVDRDLLVVRADRKEPLVVVPLKLAIQIARAAERAKELTNSRPSAERIVGLNPSTKFAAPVDTGAAVTTPRGAMTSRTGIQP
jgi:hypothetical protein